jgi:hypothetical protein
MKKIIIISLFGNINNINSRLRKIAKSLSGEITIYTPDFSHAEKKYKNINLFENTNSIKINHLHVPSYQKNLSVGRLFSHFIFAFKLKNELKHLPNKPDILICLMPPSLSALIGGIYCKKNNVKFVIDIIDLWPDSLSPLFKKNPLIKLIVWPWKFITNKAYGLADYISAESKFYALEAVKFNKIAPWSYTYLGVDSSQIQNQILMSKLNIVKNNNEIWICYGGSLGNSYDFDSILKAIKHIGDKGIKYKMFFIGDGENKKYIEEFSKVNRLNVQITGRLEYKDYLYYLSICDIGINAFKKDTLVVHSYKFNDYVATKLFIINNLKGETADMITNYKIGKNFFNDDLPDTLYDVCVNWGNYYKFKDNNNLLIKNELDGNLIYKELAKNIMK